MTLASEAALPHVLQLPPQLPHIVGVLGGASRDTRTTKGVVSHANDWKEEEAHGPQSSGQGRSAQDQEAQGSQEEGRPEESQEVKLLGGRRPQPRPPISHFMAKANAAVSPLNRAAAAKPSKPASKSKNKKEKAPAKSPAKPAAKAAAKTKATTKAKPSISPKKPAQQRPIELYYWPTPNGWKIAIMLEECGLPYEIKPVNINKGEQFAPAFLAISPNNRMPAIVDPDGPGGTPLSVFESGAILQYLGRKTGKFYPSEERQRVAVDEWLFWQVGGLGPMTGQAAHFRGYKKDDAYAVQRYTNEVHRLLGVMERRLAGRSYLADDYSIADMACVGWATAASRIDNMIVDFPNVKAWLDRVRARPAVAKGLETGKELRQSQTNDPQAQELARKVLFGQRGR
jgi:GST-like protein